jgi:hypothetical protein
MAMENFQLAHDIKRNRLTAQFRIKNTTPGSVRLSGKCVLVLRGDHDGLSQVLALPNITLTDGEPSGTEGQNFRIRHFLDFTLKAQVLPDQFSFNRGTLYVFSDKAELIAKQAVQVSLSNVKAPGPSAVIHPANQGKLGDTTAPAEIRPTEIQPQEEGLAGQASGQTPAQPAAIERPGPGQTPPAPGQAGLKGLNPADPGVRQENAGPLEAPGEPKASEPSAPGKAPERWDR